MFLHIKLSNAFAEAARSGVKHTAPARLLHFLSIQVVAVEIEVFLVEVVAQQVGAAGDDFPFQIVLDGAQVRVEDDAVHGTDEVGHPHVDATKFECRSACVNEVVSPFEIRR